MHPLHNKRLFIFDLDGTLVDAYRAIFASLNFVRKKLGYPLVPYDRVKRSVGRGDKRFITSFFKNEDKEKALSLYRRHHKRSLKQFARLKPYACSLLAYLQKKKIRVAIASNRPALYSRIIVRTVGIAKCIDYMLCGDQLGKLKPNPAILFAILEKFRETRENTVYVGDMDIDLQTAQRAKIDALFILGGSSGLKDVRKFRNKRVIRSLRDIMGFVDGKVRKP